MRAFILILTLSSFLLPGTGLAQTSVASDLSIPKEQLAAFQREADKKAKQFLGCITRVSRNKDINIRRQNMDDAVSLFEDTAHIYVSNKNTRTLKAYSVKDYIYKVVSTYYNELVPTIIEITSTPVIIDREEKDKQGNPIALVGHFEYTQHTTRCNGKKTTNGGDVPVYTDCYYDITSKRGQIRITPHPSSQGPGYQWVILISGITVSTTE